MDNLVDLTRPDLVDLTSDEIVDLCSSSSEEEDLDLICSPLIPATAPLPSKSELWKSVTIGSNTVNTGYLATQA